MGNFTGRPTVHELAWFGGSIACAHGVILATDNGLLFDEDETGLLHIQEVLCIFDSGRHR
jgi:hypothetical protein